MMGTISSFTIPLSALSPHLAGRQSWTLATGGYSIESEAKVFLTIGAVIIAGYVSARCFYMVLWFERADNEYWLASGAALGAASFAYHMLDELIEMSDKELARLKNRQEVNQGKGEG